MLMATFALTGCLVTPPSRVEPMYRPAYPTLPPASEPTAGAVSSVEVVWSLFEDNTARRVGDILTIVLEESTSSNEER